MRARQCAAPALVSIALLALVRCTTPDEADYVGGASSSDATIDTQSSNDANTSSDAIADARADVTDSGVDAASSCVAAHQRFNSVTGHCYQFTIANPNGAVWGSAESECIVLGGHLVAINDAPEQAFVVQFVKDELVGVDAAAYTSFWMGLVRDGGVTAYQWSNGDMLTFKNWAPPAPTGKPCVVQYTEGNVNAATSWDDFMCDVQTSYLCEF